MRKMSPKGESVLDSDRYEVEASQHHPPASVQPVEHDARQTGGHPERQRDALKGNTEDGAGEQHPASPAGQHATGSFTGEGRESARIAKKNGKK
jgi:hypothetical protein